VIGRFGQLFTRDLLLQGLALSTLMVLSALTEGVGLLLLVPMLGALGADGDAKLTGLPSAMIGWLPTSLPILLALFVLLVLLRAVLISARSLAALRFEIAMVDGLRCRAWSALLRCDWRIAVTLRRSDGTSMLMFDIDRIGYGVNQALGAIAQAVTLGGIGLAALAIAPWIALSALAGGGLVLLAHTRFRRRAEKLGAKLAKAYAAVLGQFTEGQGALRLIKSYGRESAAETDVTSAMADMRHSQILFLRDLGLARIALQVGAAGVLAVLVWLAIARWQISPVVVLPVVALFARALPLLGALQEASQNWAHTSPAIDGTLALIARLEAAREPAQVAIPAPSFTREIDLKAVTVQFTEAPSPALSEVTLTIPAGSITALLGPSGAGKSTLADLLSGLLSPDQGTMKIDDTALDGPRRQAWRTRVAYVQQEPVLLADTIAENLRWAAPCATTTQLETALRDAAAEFVFGLPQGIETRVGDGGRVLSGGERQRLMLARALLREPSLLILDEATSALDPDNEALISAALARLRGRMTMVIICHRGALAALADRVVRLEFGRIAGIEFPVEAA
jgi:ATP-binding cassette, subfamily C, bacterial